MYIPRVEEFIFEVVEGPEAGRQFPVSGPFEIGRSQKTQFVLEDELVSRRHAKVTPVAGGVVVEDLESSNGTFVNGDQIHSPAHLDAGDHLLVGVTVLELRSADQVRTQPSAVRPVPTAFTKQSPSPRPAAAAPGPASPADGAVPRLATPARRPDYVPRDVAGEVETELDPLLDVVTKGKAATAPIAIFVITVIAIVILLATR